ncbi:threonine aldolase family protein [Aquimarina megaterium]|uniref:threonine aldolase family protein n=1 Tax=Aquimarina megaterium TaxID=1443666 RepID=UPI0009455415|nr:beta-eliminating lyase-related protein [Aquimarina megaterium]
MYPIQNNCNIYISGHKRTTLSEEISLIQHFAKNNGISLDYFSNSDFIHKFQNEVANLLGFKEALFFPTGTMAQQILLKVNAEKTKNKNFGIHEKSHVYAFEDNAYKHLHRLKEILVGEPNKPYLVEDVKNLSENISTLIIDIPYRELGGIPIPWEELEKIKDYCKQNDILLHADGARLWECASYYKKSYKEICKGLDSIYVSLYKGIGGMAGCFLCGNSSTIKEAKKWKKRHGGKLFQETILIASSAYQFDKRLQEMSLYYKKTQEIYNKCSNFKELTFYPEKPLINLFHVHVKITVEEAILMREYFKNEKSIWLFNNIFPSQLKDNKSYFEIYVGDILLDKTVNEVNIIFESIAKYIKSLVSE